MLPHFRWLKRPDSNIAGIAREGERAGARVDAAGQD